VRNFVDPFFGSGAPLLGAPWPADRTETVNDIDGLLCNFWRALQADPEAVAHHADWPVSELDLHARHRWLVDRRADTEQLLANPEYYDAKAAGWWVWGISQWIGSGWCPPHGAASEKMPHVGDAGMGVHRRMNAHANLWKARPDLSSNGRGDAAPRLAHKRPHLGGTNTNADGTPGKAGGKGIFRPRLSQQMPHLGGDRDAGRGVHRKSLSQKIPKIGANGHGADSMSSGVMRQELRESSNLLEYFYALADRLRRVRVICGDWSRVLGPSVTWRHGLTAVFLDPPYVQAGRADVYGFESRVFDLVRAWALENGDNPLLRIAICGYDFEMPEGWELVRWKAAGGYSGQGEGRGRENAHKECIWFSPHCINLKEHAFAQFNQPIKVAETADYGPLFDLPATPQPPAALASRLAAVGCELHHDPHNDYGYHSEWRLDGLKDGPALFGSLEDVEEWLEPRKKRAEPAEQLEEMAA